MRDVDPDRVAEVAQRASHVAEVEGRIALDRVDRVEHEEPAELVAVRISETHARNHRRQLRPPPGAREPPFPLVDDATNLLVRAIQGDAHGAVQLGAAQSVVRRPGHLQDKGAVVQASRVDHEEITEAAAGRLRSIALLVIGAEHFLDVPASARMLPDVHDWMLDLDVAEQQPLVDQIARIVARRDAPAADEERIVVGIADRDRVDDDPGEEAAAYLAEIDLTLDRARELILNEPPQLLLSVARARHEEARDDGHEANHEQRNHAHEGDESATPDHAGTRRFRTRDRSRM